jgi:hypothetical protein
MLCCVSVYGCVFTSVGLLILLQSVESIIQPYHSMANTVIGYSLSQHQVSYNGCGMTGSVYRDSIKLLSYRISRTWLYTAILLANTHNRDLPTHWIMFAYQ